MKLDKKTKWIIAICSISAPIIINVLMAIPSFGFAVLDSEQWLGFFGNYSGGIIGGIVAYYIANGQIKAQNEDQRQNEIESSRSYIILEEFIAPVTLKGINTHSNSKILSNSFYKDIINDPASNGKNIPFYKVHHSGLPNIILDCHIKMLLLGEREGQIDLQPYTIETHLSVLEKSTEIFIPVANPSYNFILPQQISVTYSTIKGETIWYNYDVNLMSETHKLIKDTSGKIKNDELYHVELEGVEWIFPAKINNSLEKPTSNTNNTLSISLFGTNPPLK
jgi:hypothetical protein